VCSSVFSGHTHHSLYKLLYIIILLCVGSTAPPLVDRGMYTIYTRIQLLRAAVNTEVEVFDFDFATAAAGVKTFSSECAGPVSPLCCCNCIGIILYCYDNDHGRVVYTEESSGETNTMLHYACTHTHMLANTYDTIILYWYNMYIYICIYMCGMKYTARMQNNPARYNSDACMYNNNILLCACECNGCTSSGLRRRVSFNWRQCGRGAFARDRL